MLYQESTPIGNITYGKSLLSGIVMESVHHVAMGRAFPSDGRGRLLKPGKPAANTTFSEEFVDAKLVGERLSITINLIIRFGAGLSKTLDDIDREVRMRIPPILGLKVDELALMVTGVLAKNISRRNLCFMYYADGTRKVPMDLNSELNVNP